MGSSCRIECIFFSEFHPTLGPKITYQVPSTLPELDEERDALRSSAACLEGLRVPVLHPGMSFHSQITLNGGEDTETRVPGS